MKRTALLLVVAAACLGCGPEALPAPSIVSIVPAQMAANIAPTVTVTLEAVLPFVIDYGQSAATVDRSLVLSIGSTVIATTDFSSSGALQTVVPSVFVPGMYDVSVLFGDGRQTSLADGFTVNPGLWPQGYSIDPISDQQHGVPFAVTIRAVGANSSTFSGTVNLTSSKGSFTPQISGPFTNGVRVENVLFSAAQSGNVTLRAADLNGSNDTSNGFHVN